MRTALFWMLAILALVGGTAPSNAAPITAYYDQAAWDAATAGLEIGPYAGGATRTDYVTTIGVGPTGVCPVAGICVFGTTATAQPSAFDSLVASFSYDSVCQPMCSATSKLTLELDHEIMGFGAMNLGCILGTDLTVNGIGIGTGAPCGTPQFFGLVGPISSLEFTGSPFTDSPQFLNFQNILVAEVPEPGELALFGAGLLLLAGLRRKTGRA